MWGSRCDQSLGRRSTLHRPDGVATATTLLPSDSSQCRIVLGRRSHAPGTLALGGSPWEYLPLTVEQHHISPYCLCGVRCHVHQSFMSICYFGNCVLCLLMTTTRTDRLGGQASREGEGAGRFLGQVERRTGQAPGGCPYARRTHAHRRLVVLSPAKTIV